VYFGEFNEFRANADFFMLIIFFGLFFDPENGSNTFL
jgi:hypothetical protein